MFSHRFLPSIMMNSLYFRGKKGSKENKTPETQSHPSKVLQRVNSISSEASNESKWLSITRRYTQI